MDKLPQIQVARALAALSVVYYHSYIALREYHAVTALPLPFFTQWGFLGVNFFFVISGFIIGLVCDRSDFRPVPFTPSAIRSRKWTDASTSEIAACRSRGALA